jgi:hypothetical protein
VQSGVTLRENPHGLSEGGYTDTDPGWVQVSPLRSWHLGRPIRFAHLDRPLGQIVADGPQYEEAVMARIDAAVEYFVDVVLAIENGRGVCRSASALPAAGGLPPVVHIPVAEFVRNLMGVIQEVQPAYRPRSLTPDRLREVAKVYRSNPKRPAAAVAEYLGGTGHARAVNPDELEEERRARLRARARASRAIDAAREQGYLGKAPGERRKGEKT